MKQIFELKLTERAIQAKIKSAQIIFDQEIALWHVIVQKGSAEIEVYNIVSPYDFYKVYRFWEGEVDHIFLEEDIEQQFAFAKQEWERIRALARMHEFDWLDVPYMFAAANKLDVFLLTDKIQNALYGFRFIHNSVNSLDIGVITLSENLSNVMREDYTSRICSFFALSTDLRKTAHIIFYDELDEIVKDFLENPYWFDGEPKELEFGIVTSSMKGILSIKNGDFEINTCASPFRKDIFTIYEDALTNNRPPICVPDFPYATWYANRNNIVFK